jgi:glutaryl-CoA dehydrogenase
MTRFSGVDFYETEPLLSEEDRAIRDQVRGWVEDRYLPIIEEAYERARFPVEVIPELAAMGLLGATLPEKYGCAGVSYTSYGLAMQELERGDSGLRSFVSVQGALCMFPIHEYGTEAQRQKWLPAMARGEVLGCFGLTEPDHGSDPSGMTTRAVRKDGGYRINGAKMWITNGTIADLAIVWARLRDDATGEDDYCAILVEKGTPGYSAPEQKHKHSLRASVTSELVLEDVWVPEENRLPGTRGLRSALACLSQARYGIAWGVLGAAMACYHCATEHAKTRIMFGKPIGSFQMVQEKLAVMLTEITKGQLLALQLGRLKDAGRARPGQISMAKRNNCEIALDVAREARDILGASGITSEYPVMRHMCNLESVKTYEGTHSIHTLVLGQEITGIPAYR